MTEPHVIGSTLGAALYDGLSNELCDVLSRRLRFNDELDAELCDRLYGICNNRSARRFNVVFPLALYKAIQTLTARCCRLPGRS